MRGLASSTAAAALLVSACAQDSTTKTPTTPPAETSAVQQEAAAQFETVEHEQFDAPWALEFLPGTQSLLITERTGALKLRSQDSGEVREVSGAPEVVDAGQGGMHDVIAGPTFGQDRTIYLSWVRSAEGGTQGVVGRAQLDTDQAALENLEVIWEQDPAAGDGHFSLRMIVLDEMLYVTSGDRQQMEPAQDMSTNLGTIVRLRLDGDPAPGNPFADAGGTASQFWTIGHRNPLGIASDSHGNLWSSEMGPQGGDELNLIREGANYGWPQASMGVHYDGTEIADHTEGDGFESPKAHWVPAISPGNLMIYQGELFTGWQDSALLGGLSGENLVRVELDGETAEPADEWDVGERIRAVEESPDGAVWVATDGGSLMELRPGQ
ncbi:PQQ-dependent sugar dehydrogenase [Garicola koreensis]|uniref:Glucose/arabinose dehydrogenase n=1 Tax=Garicola koreensis TaxID=1262554 RepID=A0A7W5TWM1_9MICC|nr:PQQ-dependent sugar dehydrogenase [Garicola koreensis]MBB3668214.1 glucose/arabinose dehydrogenase [Garicola koreensis]